MAGPVTAVYWLRRAAALAGDEKTGNAVGTILTAFLLPFILIIVCLCGMMDAAADHNRAAVEWCFGDGAIPAAVPEEYAGHITQMRACFAVLDGAVGKLNAELEEGSVPLRANRVKADFFALNFGAPDLTLRQGQAESFAGCYVSEAVRIRTVEVPNPEYDPPENEEELEDYDVPKTIEVEQEYMVTVPEKDMAVVYAPAPRPAGRGVPGAVAGKRHGDILSGGIRRRCGGRHERRADSGSRAGRQPGVHRRDICQSPCRWLEKPGDV